MKNATLNDCMHVLIEGSDMDTLILIHAWMNGGHSEIEELFEEQSFFPFNSSIIP